MLRRLITFWNAGSELGLSDPDAIAFYNALSSEGGNLSKDEKIAINNLVIDLKTENLWGKLSIIYPFVGGSAISHKFNLKNPNYATLTWYNTVFHTSFGVQGDGFSGHGRMGVELANTNTDHFALYSRTNVDTGTDAGSVAAHPGRGVYVGFNPAVKAGGTTYWAHKDSLVRNPGTPNLVDTLGFIVTTINPENQSEKQVYQNTELKITNPRVKAGFGFDSFTCDRGAGEIYILARRFYNFSVSPGTYSTDSYSNRQYSFMSFGTALTQLEITNLTTIVHNFQANLGRQI